MKLLIPLVILTALSTNAHAQPGSHTLYCQSAKNSGSNQRIKFFLRRGNAVGMYAPIIKLHVDSKQIVLTTPEDTNNYGSTFHNSPLGAINVSVNVPRTANDNTGFLSIVAIPATVKALDYENNPAKPWSIEAQKEGCYDIYGKAKFQGYIEGYVVPGKDVLEVETQILDCELSYDPGMSC